MRRSPYYKELFFKYYSIAFAIHPGIAGALALNLNENHLQVGKTLEKPNGRLTE